ncbi:MAG: hypothetical protein WBF90_34800 [Rivularia sp. (in: cyanobacteria)]|jgi:hypothetical protein
MSYTQNNSNGNYCACEFTIPIRLHVPITIDTPVYINPVPIMKQTLPVVIEPDLVLQPEVKAKAPQCYPQQLPCPNPEMLSAGN